MLLLCVGATQSVAVLRWGQGGTGPPKGPNLA